MENMTAISVIALMPATKAQQQAFSTQVIDAVLNGEIDPLKVDVYLKSIEDTIATIRKHSDVKRVTIDAAEKYAEKSFEAYGAKVTLVTKSTKNYAACGDDAYNAMTAQMDALKAAIKAREAALDAGVDPGTGEELKKPTVTFSPYLKIEFK